MTGFPVFASVFLSVFVSLPLANAQTTAFNYQGKLDNGGVAANGAFQMQFKLFDSLAGAGQVGPTIPDVPVTATEGVFGVRIDFGSNALTGANRWLEIAVRQNAGEAYTTLAPREQIASAPYSVRTLSAASADIALDSNKLGGIAAGEFVTITSGGNSFIRNNIVQQPAANFNISGSGTAGSLNANGPVSLGGVAPPAAAPAGQGRIYFDSASNKVKISENSGAFINLVGAGGVSGSGTTNSIPFWSAGTTLGNSQITQSANGVQLPNGVQLAAGAQGNAVAFGSPNFETGMSISGAAGRADLRFDGSILKLVTIAGPGIPGNANGIAIDTAGNVGIGTTTPGVKLEVSGGTKFTPGGTGGAIQFGTPGGETGMTIIGANRADLKFDGSTFKINTITGTGVPSPTNGIAINTAGNVGMGTTSPLTRLALNGGLPWTSNGWTGSLSTANGSALGWEANASGQRFGIGQSTGGLYFFRTNSAFGTTGSPANYDLAIQDDGNITQNRGKAGLVKAMLYVNADGSIARCYNGITNASTGNCGFGTGIVTGTVVINFGFQVNDRFVSVVPRMANSVNIGVEFAFDAWYQNPLGPNEIAVHTFITDVDQVSSAAPNPFIIIVY